MNKTVFLWFLLGCNSYVWISFADEGDEHVLSFLQLQDGTVWIDTGDYTDQITYLKFINDEAEILHIYNKFLPSGRECYTCYGITEIWGEVEIIENSESKLILTIHPPDWELNSAGYCFECTEEQTILLTFCLFDENHVKIEKSCVILEAVAINVDLLDICNE